MSKEVSFAKKYRACLLFKGGLVPHSLVLKMVGHRKDPQNKLIWGWFRELQSLGVVRSGYINPTSRPNISPRVTLQGLNSLIRLMFPEGSSEKNLPILIGDLVLWIIFFKPKPDHISFGLFLGSRRYSRMTILVSNDGTTSQDAEGVIPEIDLTKNEPCFSGLEPTEIALMVAFQLKALSAVGKI